MYSLVNVAVLCRDLSRHERAPAMVERLLEVLGAGPDTLDRLQQVPVDGAARGRAWADVTAATRGTPRALRALAEARAQAETRGLAAYLDSADVLRSAPFGTLPDLVRMVRDDVLADDWRRDGDVSVLRHPHAVMICADAVAGAYAAATCVASAAVLERPWHAVPHAAAPVDDPGLADLVARLGGLGRASLTAVGTAFAQARESRPSWPELMHEACWAAYLTGRTRSLAVAQLHALRALLAAADGAPPPSAVVAAVVGAVHARGVRDVVDAGVVAALSAPLAAGVRF